MTEIYDYLRLLFARAGKTISPVSGREVKKDDVPDVVKAIQACKEGDKILILASFKSHSNRDTREELNILLQKGFSRLLINNEVMRIEDLIENSTFDIRNSHILIDRLVKKEFDEDDLHRIADSVGLAFYEGEGIVHLVINSKKKLEFSNKFELDGIVFEEPVPNLFSFNNHMVRVLPVKGFLLYLDSILT
jgi:excinuclease ABC subunit A